MTLDIIIYPIIMTVAIIAACYGISRVKIIWIIGAMLYLLGGFFYSAAAYLIFYPLTATHHVFIPAVVAFFVWSLFCLRLFLPDTFLSRVFPK